MESKIVAIEKILKRSWLSFILSIVLALIVHLFNAIDFHPLHEFISPIKGSFIESADVMRDIISPRLEEIKNNYSINYHPSLFIPQVSADDSTLSESTGYALVEFDSGDVMMQKNLSQKLSIASLTKIMTAVVALDLTDINERFSVTKNASNQIPTKIGIVEGQRLTVDELLNAVLLTSANDAAELLKDGIDNKYGEEVFIKAMNEKAKLIGLKNTSFTNAQGFDNKNHYSTVEDLVILSHYALTNYPEIAEIVKKDYEFIEENLYHNQFDLNNWNGLIGVYPETIGIKIGNTQRAGKTTIVVSEREGKKLLAVVLGAPTIFERDLWAAELLDTGYSALYGFEPINITRSQLQEKYDSWYSTK